MAGLSDWLDPSKSLPAMFSKKTAFGLNPLNIGGKADPDRASFTAPGTTLLRDEKRLKYEQEYLLSQEKEALEAKENEAILSKERIQARDSARTRQKRIAASTTGRRNTILTSPLGVADSGATGQRKSLLGT